MGRILHVDCSRGVSGDMMVAALIDCGVDIDGLKEALASLDLDGFEVRVTHKRVGGMAVCDFDVILADELDGHDHDMTYLYGNLDETPHATMGHHHMHDDEHGHHHEHPHGQGHTHPHEHEHLHEHERPHEHEYPHGHEHGHHHTHRNLADVKAIIDAGTLTTRTRALAYRIFEIVAEAEAEAHGTTVDEVHFHEVGAVDSIVDVVSAAYCIDALDVSEVIVTALGEGHGRIRSAHGVLDVPVPAVASIAAAHHLVLAPRDIEGELVTPTGAAIVAAIRTGGALPAAYTIISAGTGVGKRAYDPPSTVRALLLEPAEGGEAVAPDAAGAYPANTDAPNLWKLECEVDDCTGEALAAAVEHLYRSGAWEAHFLPVFMKKGRPGYQLEALCDAEHIPMLERVLFEDTTTIGVRRSPQWRTALPREARVVQTPYGAAQAKAVTLPSGTVRLYPEHESVAAIAAAGSLSYQDAWRAVLAACRAE